MLFVDVDRSQFRRLARALPGRHQSAMRSALRAEAYRLRKVEQEYARGWGGGRWSALHPITGKVRKKRRQGLGKWWARFTRYHVDPDRLEAMVGILSRDQLRGSTPRFEPISRGFAAAAYRHARGYKFRVTRKTQAALAKILRERFKRTKRLMGLLPKIGLHTVEARPVAEEVHRMERARTIRNLRHVYKVKMEGGRYDMADLMRE